MIEHWDGMVKSTEEKNRKVLRLLLRPIVRFCLRYMLPIQSLTEEAKAVFLELATAELRRNQEKVNVSRLSVLTGLRRREVSRFQLEEHSSKEMTASLPARVLGMWEQDKSFLTKAGKPRVLSCDGDESEFSRLVAKVSKDLHPGTILFELKRQHAVEETSKGVKMIRSEQVLGHDPIKAYDLLSADIDDLFCGVEHNLSDVNSLKNLHAKTEYDNICASDLDEIKTWFLKEGTSFHLRARNFLAQYDRDINPERNDSSPPCRVCIGTFSRTEEPQE